MTSTSYITPEERSMMARARRAADGRLADAIRGALAMLAESAKQHRRAGDDAHAHMCDKHAGLLAAATYEVARYRSPR